MDLLSFSFLGFSLLAIMVLRTVTLGPWRIAALLALNLLFLASFIQKPVDLFPVAAMLAIGYGLIRIVSISRWRLLLPLTIGVLIVGFAVLKQYDVLKSLLPAHMPTLMVVGLSYILFRQIHLLIDVAQGVRPCPPLLGYINYCLFFATFVSGPIARFEQVEKQMKTAPAPLTVPELHACMLRILLGIFLVVFCSAYASTVIEFVKDTRSLSNPAPDAWIKTAQLFSVVCMAALVKLYTNFAGSMHIVIGISRLCGIDLPENFNKPYLARNFLDFWSRWHITLSDWIKTYLFNPLLLFLTRRFPSPRATTAIGSIAFFVAFFIIGIWHGTSSAFAIFGLMLGIGAVTNKLWQQSMTKWFGKARYKSISQRGWYAQIARGLTLAYIALSLICIWVEPDYFATRGAVWALGIMTLSLVMLTIALTAIGVVADAIYARLLPLLQHLRAPHSEIGMSILMGLFAFVVFNHIGAFGSGTPELIYQGF